MTEIDLGAPPPGAGRAWLLTFADLVTLILTFFVMLYAMQQVDSARWGHVADSLSRSLDPNRADSRTKPQAERGAVTLSPERAADLSYIETLLAEKARTVPLLAEIAIELYDDRLVLALPSDLLFARGSADIADKARTVLYELGPILGTIGNTLAVEGHTDPDPPASDAVFSNRALSLARALAVADALRALGYLRDIAATGYGDSRFAELAAIEPRERRYALARRVEVVVRPYRGTP
jgi:chemotaxis protein MotB